MAQGGDKRRSDREGGAAGQPRGPQRRITSVPSGELPKWVKEEVLRSTPKDRREPALAHLAKAVDQYASERFAAALPELRKAKALAPRAATIREMLGLAAYNTSNWEEALRELRTFRRLTGESTHMPVEMDCLRALKRPQDVAKTWAWFQEVPSDAATGHEARVVYASFLLDQGRHREAWDVIKPNRLVASPSPAELRRWFVAARVALAAGDRATAARLLSALEEHEPDFAGIEELRTQLL